MGLAFLLILHPPIVHAELEDGLAVNDVVVAATRIPMASSQISAAATVLTTADIERTPFRSGTQIDDLLRYVPSVQPSTLSSRYNHPTAQAVSIRGLGTRRALVLLDGVPLNDGDGLTGDWCQIEWTASRSFPAEDRTCTGPGRWAG